tara:strand:+ start:1446 stop:3335 length:1890 start_codon:yes stop_codon:yes gene_type:complete
MNNIYEQLSWLEKPPVDFAKRLRMARSEANLRELAKYALDENELRRLSKKANTLRVSSEQPASFKTLKMGIISNSTTSLALSALVGTALRYGISLQVYEAEFNQVAQEAFSADSAFYNLSLDVILLAIDHTGLHFVSCPGDKYAAEANIQDSFKYLNNVLTGLKSKTGAQIIMQNIVSPAELTFGSYERQLSGTLSSFVSGINRELDLFKDPGVFILDIAGLSANIGLSNWHDPTLWNMAKISFSQRYIPIYADYVCRILAAQLGKSRRCLVLDLDNTLWGGVIGDDGLEGILIGNAGATAEAHLHIQRTALMLRERGVILAVCSKNEDEIARKPFKEHPDMLIREEHIAVFQANWSDKASNIRAISEALSLGLDSMVFLDDNPAERKQVRDELPEVAVPELPIDPALYVPTILAAGYFESINFSEEDKKRAGFYQANAKRVKLVNQYSDINSYLKSLDMEISFRPFDEKNRPRILQLISKSNQFNLTTKRYTQKDLLRLEADENYFTRQIRLKDIFGDNGMICVIVCKKDKDAWEIDSWLMSCRVLERKVELACLQDIVKNALASRAKKLIGSYIPTPRNNIVKEHYKKLGFNKVSKGLESETWELDIQDLEFQEIPIRTKTHDQDQR